MTRETRKIQKVGGSTFSVSLPKSWAEAQELAAGSPVTVYAHPEDVLVVEPGEEDDSAERTVLVEHEDPERLESVVRAAYAGGMDAIEIEATDVLTREQRRAVGRVTEELPGTAVVEEREDRMVVRVLLDGAEVSIEQSVRQLAFVTTAMHREAIDALVAETTGASGSGAVDADEPRSPTPDPMDRHAEADRLFALVDRHFQRGLSRIETLDGLDATRRELADCRATARELQRIAADARQLGALSTRPERGEPPETSDGLEASDGIEASDGPDPPNRSDLREFGERARDVVETATATVVGDADAAAAPAAIERGEQLRADVVAAERERYAADDRWKAQALEHCRRTADHGVAIARLGLRGAIRRGELSENPMPVEAQPPGSNTLLEDVSPDADDPGEAIDSIDGEGAVEAEPPDAAPDADGD